MDWQMLILEIRREYKTLTKVAPLVDMSVDRLRNIARKGTRNMLYENGAKIIALHKKLNSNKG